MTEHPPSLSVPYHRLGHADPNHRWWKPLVELVIALGIFLILQVLIGLLWLVGMMFFDPESLTALTRIGPTGAPEGTMTSPWLFSLLCVSVIAMLPAVILARLSMGPRPLGLLSSVIGRLRWGWMMTCLGIGLGIYILGEGVFTLLSLGVGDPLPGEPATGGTLVIMLLLTLLLVPVQCAAEEYAFRAYPMQTIGRWLRHPLWAVLLPVPLFILGHGYDFWGQASVGTMAVVAGWLCVRTGGVEAAIGLHTVNNLTVMTLGVFGLADPFAEGGSTALSFIIAAAFELVYAFLVIRLFDRRGHQRFWTPPPAALPAAPPAASPAPGPPVPPCPPGPAGDTPTPADLSRNDAPRSDTPRSDTPKGPAHS